MELIAERLLNNRTKKLFSIRLIKKLNIYKFIKYETPILSEFHSF